MNYLTLEFLKNEINYYIKKDYSSAYNHENINLFFINNIIYIYFNIPIYGKYYAIDCTKNLHYINIYNKIKTKLTNDLIYSKGMNNVLSLFNKKYIKINDKNNIFAILF